jgi:ketosteroid isomerase-like protein
MKDAEQVAEQFRAGFEESLVAGWNAVHDTFTDRIEIRHVPPSPADAYAAREVSRAHVLRQSAAYAKAMSDLRYAADVRAEGDRVLLDVALDGTLQDGTTIHIPFSIAYTVQNGQITRLDSALDPAIAEPAMKALAAGGFDFSQLPEVEPLTS